MKFKTHNNSKNINTGGTSLVGNIFVSYKELVKAFGEPTTADEYKSDAEWELEFADGEVATIYNYKDGKNYLGQDGMKTEKITDWHIGGKSIVVLKRISEILKIKDK